MWKFVFFVSFPARSRQLWSITPVFPSEKRPNRNSRNSQLSFFVSQKNCSEFREKSGENTRSSEPANADDGRIQCGQCGQCTCHGWGSSMVGILRIAEANKLPKDDQFGSLENTRETCRLKEYVYMYIYIYLCTHVGVYIYIST